MTSNLSDKPGHMLDDSSTNSALALVGLAVCEAAGRLHSLSLVFLLLTFITGSLLPWRSGGGVSVVLPLLIAGLAAAACQAYFAWRLAFDRQVFAAWARLPEDNSEPAQRAFDTALGILLKKSVTAGDSRSMLDRVIGLRRLHLLQITALFGQMLTLLVLMLFLL